MTPNVDYFQSRNSAKLMVWFAIALQVLSLLGGNKLGVDALSLREDHPSFRKHSQFHNFASSANILKGVYASNVMFGERGNFLFSRRKRRVSPLFSMVENTQEIAEVSKSWIVLSCTYQFKYNFVNFYFYFAPYH